MQEACAFKLHNTFLVSVLLNTWKGNYHQSTRAIHSAMHCMIMSIGILENRVFVKFSLQLNIHMYIKLYLVTSNVTYVMKEKSNTDMLYTILTNHLIYEGF